MPQHLLNAALLPTRPTCSERTPCSTCGPPTPFFFPFFFFLTKQDTFWSSHLEGGSADSVFQPQVPVPTQAAAGLWTHQPHPEAEAPTLPGSRHCGLFIENPPPLLSSKTVSKYFSPALSGQLPRVLSCHERAGKSPFFLRHQEARRTLLQSTFSST